MQGEIMEVLKQHKSTFSKLGFCYLAGTAAIYLLQLLLSICLTAVMPQWLEDTNIRLILSGVTVYGVGMPLIALLAGKIPARQPERHAMKWWQFILALIICYGLMVASNLVGVLITMVISVFKGSAVQNNLAEVVMDGNMLLNFVLMVIVAPVMEEYVFRKILVDRTLCYGQGVAVVMSGLMFGLFHGNLNQFAYAVVLGGFFAFFYVKTGNLKVTIGMHAIINFLGSVVVPKVMELINYEEIFSADLSDPSEVMELVMGNLGSWMIFLFYVVAVYAVVFAGIILFIVFACCRKFQVEPGEVRIPKGRRFQVVLANPGMAVFCITWIILIIIQLLR